MIKNKLELNNNAAVNTYQMQALKKYFSDFFDKEGKFEFDKLELFLKESDVDLSKEGYELNFLGKSYARLQTSLETKTVITPDNEHNNKPENINSENIYISGDNLDGIKHLLKSYSNKIKCIYIDPPYNTGNEDFVYPDNFEYNAKSLSEKTGIEQEEAERIINMKGTSTHSAWLTFMHPRLFLARDLLTDDGVIFISIDENEQANLKLLCDEVFEEQNFIGQLVWEKKKKGSYLADGLTTVKEYILVYCRNKDQFNGLIGQVNTETETYPCVNASNGREKRIIEPGIISKYKEKDFFLPKGHVISDTTMNLVLHSDLVIKNGILAEQLIIEGNWRYSQESMREYAEGSELYITRDLYLRRIVTEPRSKGLKDLLLRLGEEDQTGTKNINLNNLNGFGWGSNEDADEEQRIIFGTQGIMSYPKPVILILKLLSSIQDKEAIYLDFFAGSSTTAHAVMELNQLDNGNRKYIMMQLPENIGAAFKTAKGANKLKYKKIIDFLDDIEKPHLLSEIGIERIKRAAKIIKKEDTKDIDYGFKIFNLNTPAQNTLDKIIDFDPESELITEDMIDNFSFHNLSGAETVLQTWKVEDGFGFTFKHEDIVLNEYIAHLCKNTLYMINNGIKTEDIIILIEKLENSTLPINRIIVFPYSLGYSETEELKKNIKVLKNAASVKIIERY